MGLVYPDSATGGGQPLLGITGEFKYNYATYCVKRRRSNQFINLIKAKPDMVVLQADFIAAQHGTRMEEEEFVYVSPDQMLKLTNLTSATGLTPSGGPEPYAIPINFIPTERVVLNTIHAQTEIE